MDARKPELSNLTFLGRDSGLSRAIGRPLKRFLEVQAAGGILMLVAAAVALIWANSAWADSYDQLWHTHLDITIGDFDVFSESLLHFVNDALMALFFFVAGLEIKRELVTGSLRNPRDAVLPAFAALGGMVVPALIYVGLNLGEAAVGGWGIPTATDIAFAVGVLSLLGDRVPRPLKIFLLTLAIVDDIGAIVVIALFYPSEDGLSALYIVISVAIALLIWVMSRLRIWVIPVYVAVGTVFWWTTYKSGVHATIAGVVLGFLTPATPLQTQDQATRVTEWLRDKEEVFLVNVRYANFHIRESVSVAERIEASLHPYTSYLIIPIFALANAGVSLSGDNLSSAMSSTVTWGVILGFVVGKTAGITLFSLGARAAGLCQFPRELTLARLVGVAMVAGIGFTVSLFVAGLAFEREVSAIDEAKIGILVASALAGTIGSATVSWGLRNISE